MKENRHFISADSWDAAAELVSFRPLIPRFTAGFELGTLEVYARDHKGRQLPVESRSLEAHYGGFVLSQSRESEGEAQRKALAVSYGADGYEVSVLGRDGRAYELGPEVPPDDVDGRSPAVVVWHEGDRFYLVASGELTAEVLLEIAQSMHLPAPMVGE